MVVTTYCELTYITPGFASTHQNPTTQFPSFKHEGEVGIHPTSNVISGSSSAAFCGRWIRPLLSRTFSFREEKAISLEKLSFRTWPTYIYPFLVILENPAGVL